MGWAGIGEYLDRATARIPDGAAMRGECASCPVLQGIADQIGQAYDRPEVAAGIIESAEKRHEVLKVRAAVAGQVLADARAKLIPSPPKPEPPKFKR
jgi:hypothetical protein